MHKFIIYSLVIVGVVGSLVIMSRPGDMNPTHSAADIERNERITCTRYIEAVQRRAVQCNNEGFQVRSWATTPGLETDQMRACMMTSHSWKRSGSKTAECIRVVSSASCTDFGYYPWLSAPPCS